MWLGFPLADPIVGLLIAAAILVIVWQSGKTVFTRLLDGVDPEVVRRYGTPLARLKAWKTSPRSGAVGGP